MTDVLEDRWRAEARCRELGLDEAETLLRAYVAKSGHEKLAEALTRRLVRLAPKQGALPSIGRPTPHVMWDIVFWNRKQQGYDEGYATESETHMAEWRVLLFFPSERDDGSKEALRYAAPAAVCDACPVRAACLEANMAEPKGVYGGLSQESRRRLRVAS